MYSYIAVKKKSLLCLKQRGSGYCSCNGFFSAFFICSTSASTNTCCICREGIIGLKANLVKTVHFICSEFDLEKSFGVKYVLYKFTSGLRSIETLVPLRDDVSPGQVGTLDAEAAVLQRLRQWVFQCNLCSKFPFYLWFTQDLQRTNI